MAHYTLPPLDFSDLSTFYSTEPVHIRPVGRGPPLSPSDFVCDLIDLFSHVYGLEGDRFAVWTDIVGALALNVEELIRIGQSSSDRLTTSLEFKEFILKTAKSPGTISSIELVTSAGVPTTVTDWFGDQDTVLLHHLGFIFMSWWPHQNPQSQSQQRSSLESNPGLSDAGSSTTRSDQSFVSVAEHPRAMAVAALARSQQRRLLQDNPHVGIGPLKTTKDVEGAIRAITAATASKLTKMGRNLLTLFKFDSEGSSSEVETRHSEGSAEEGERSFSELTTVAFWRRNSLMSLGRDWNGKISEDFSRGGSVATIDAKVSYVDTTPRADNLNSDQITGMDLSLQVEVKIKRTTHAEAIARDLADLFTVVTELFHQVASYSAEGSGENPNHDPPFGNLLRFINEGLHLGSRKSLLVHCSDNLEDIAGWECSSCPCSAYLQSVLTASASAE
ncbi:hypothetical protein DFP72DRAFT_857818 [Ephemerocybe angulata]|uniref:Uncharacterized protein n=1 Tax=Ephemerocybe angulata TaxID=980116 RepID=A0A8H6HBY3_9AGAR|nr:hypothetical protein DFP72DRAFT_857818 [Tulosesus angulatus]